MTRRFATRLVATVAFLVSGSATAGLAHSQGPYYPAQWATGIETYHFTSGFPIGDLRQRIKDGLAPWNNVVERT